MVPPPWSRFVGVVSLLAACANGTAGEGSGTDGTGSGDTVVTSSGDTDNGTSDSVGTDSASGTAGDTDGAPSCDLAGDAPVTTVWSDVLDIDGGDDSLGHIAVDADGNVVVGGAATIDGQSDMLVAKYGIDGTLLWSRTYDGESHGIDGTNGVGVDADGNVLVVGSAFTSDPMFGLVPTLVMHKYDPDGTLLWSDDTPVEPPNPTVLSNALAVRPDGSVVVVGTTASGSGFFRAYEADGNELWTLLDMVVKPLDVASDSQGDLVVAGHDGTNGVVQKRDAAGAELWIRNTPGTGMPDHYIGSAASVVVGPDDAMVLAGIESYLIGSPMQPRDSWSDLFAQAFDAAGTELWVATFEASDWPQLDVTMDAESNVYLLSSPMTGPLVRGLDAAGVTQWELALPCPNRAFGIDATMADVHVAGRVDTVAQGTDAFLARFAPVP